jgi:uncharacterized membrane protein YecN with MAPEG domain
MPVTAGYAALLGFLFIYLSFRTIRLRTRLRVGLGDGGQPPMLRAMRTHANFAEYVPFALLLIYFVERYTVARGWAHVLCLLLIAGRLCHAYGFGRDAQVLRLRVMGTALTLTVIIAASVRLLWVWILSLTL